MKIIIVGAGTLGVQIARELVAENRDVVVVERNPDIARGIANELDCLVQEGDGENPEVLEAAGAADADWFIALTGSDETNIVSCGLVADAFSKPKTIARVRSHYFGSFRTRKRRILGVDHILNPESETAEAVARLIFRGMSPEVIDVKEAGIQLRRMTASEDNRFPGKRLKEIRADVGRDFIITAVTRGQEFIIPGGEFVIAEDDLVYLLGEPGELDRLFGKTVHPSVRLKYLVVLGAEALTHRLFKELGVPGPESSGDRTGALSLLGSPIIKVIDKRKEYAKALSKEFPDVEVVCRDLTDEFIVEEEGIGKADIVLGLTESQSLNIVTALLARQSGSRKTLAVVHNDLYMRLAGSVDIDAIVNLKSVVAGSVLDIVRKAHIRRLYGFAEADFELVEITVDSEFARAGAKIRDLGIPRGILVAFVIHEGKTIIPTGDTGISASDTVGLVLAKKQIGRLESIFGA